MASRTSGGAVKHPDEAAHDHYYRNIADLAYDQAEAPASSKPPRTTQYSDPQSQEPTLGRTTSRRRRSSGRDYGYGQEYDTVVTAPDASPSAKGGPPVSFRDPYQNGDVEEPGRSPKSFAARAGVVPDRDPAPHPTTDPDPGAGDARHRRRSSDDRSRPRDLHIEPPRREIAEDARTRGETAKKSPAAESSRRRQSADARVQRNLEPGVSRSATSAKSPPVRSATVKSSAGGSPGDWAADRSPLQRLEVKLNDISKEEKRARVQEAEQRLRDAQARKDRRHASQPLEPVAKRATSQRAASGPASQRAASGPTSQPREQTRELGPLAGNRAVDRGIDGQGRSKPRLETTAAATNVDQSRNVPKAYSQDEAGAGLLAAEPAAASATRRQGSSKTYRQDDRDAGLLAAEPASSPRTKESSTRRRSADVTKPEDRGVRFHSDVKDVGPSSATTEDKPSRKLGSVHKSATSRGQDLPPAGKDPAIAPPTGQEQIKPDPIPPEAVPSHHKELKYSVPPQTAGGIEARQKIGFGSRVNGTADASADDHHHHLPHLFHRKGHQPADPAPLGGPPRHLDEWRTGEIARLTIADMAAEPDVRDAGKGAKDTAWWEAPQSQRRKSRTEALEPQSATYDGSNENANGSNAFSPPLYLTCGPLLRYTGLRRDKIPSVSNDPPREREIWRGSVLIVTDDARSEYRAAVPTMRLFHQPMKLLPPPPQHLDEDGGEELPSEYVDPVGGLPKLSRTGGVVYVKPVEDLDPGHDVSRLENDDGLYEETRTASVPTSYGKADEFLGRSPSAALRKNQSSRHERARTGRYREVQAVRLHAERGVTFWRFNLEVELHEAQSRVAYSINRSASVGFWVPARGAAMHVMFHSCNGFSLSVDPNVFAGPDPLWRDVLNAHQTQPFHVMLGGGDQIYNDAVMRDTTHFRAWLEMNPVHKHDAPFTPEMQDELEGFFLERYAMWFSQGLFGMAAAQIPMVNMWDDHDIIDGFGSYPHHFMRSPVFCGLGAVAFKYYMLFQHQSVVDEVTSDEPSWLLGASPGPYINELSRSVFMFLGKRVAFLGLDCRTERMRDEILSEESYNLIFDRCHKEIVKGETKHLIVLLGVPIAYPRLVWLENILTSRALDPVKAMGRMGLLGNFMNKFDGGVEILDDLDDHWTARNHKMERNWFVEELQELAAEKSVRVTILG